MKVIGISAAPTKNSRSEQLIDSLLHEFRAAGDSVETIFVRDLKISFCDGLLGCEKTGKCKYKDDIDLAERAISSADVVIVSSPIYFTSLPAKLKAVVDRSQLYWARKNILKTFSPAPKKGLFVAVSGGTPDFSHAEVVVRAFFSVFNIKLGGTFYISNSDKISEEQFTKALDDVKKLKSQIA